MVGDNDGVVVGDNDGVVVGDDDGVIVGSAVVGGVTSVGWAVVGDNGDVVGDVVGDMVGDIIGAFVANMISTDPVMSRPPDRVTVSVLMLTLTAGSVTTRTTTMWPGGFVWAGEILLVPNAVMSWLPTDPTMINSSRNEMVDRSTAKVTVTTASGTSNDGELEGELDGELVGEIVGEIVPVCRAVRTDESWMYGSVFSFFGRPGPRPGAAPKIVVSEDVNAPPVMTVTPSTESVYEPAPASQHMPEAPNWSHRRIPSTNQHPISTGTK